MISTDPATARPRTDLPWLRHRSPRPAAAAPAAPPAPAPAPVPPPPPPASTPLDLPTAPPTTAPEAPDPPSGSSLDLPPLPPPSAPSQAPADLSPPTSGSSLDLPPLPEPGDLAAPGQPPRPSSGAASAASTSPRPSGPSPSGGAVAGPPAPARVQGGTTSLLTGPSPTVTLTRVQSGVGALRIQAACAETVGDIRIGCAYELWDGTTSLVQRTGGPATAPPSGGRPVIRTSRERFETLTLDLAQVRDLRRMAVYLYSETHRPLTWSGTVTIETYGRSRIEIPLDRPQSGGVLVALSVYNVRGELVLRNEDLLVAGAARAAAVALGYDRISWVDEHTPLH